MMDYSEEFNVSCELHVKKQMNYRKLENVYTWFVFDLATDIHG